MKMKYKNYIAILCGINIKKNKSKFKRGSHTWCRSRQTQDCFCSSLYFGFKWPNMRDTAGVVKKKKKIKLGFCYKASPSLDCVIENQLFQIATLPPPSSTIKVNFAVK